jgi:hypothetical protein
VITTLLAQMRLPEGRIVGGWNYVWMAYGLTWFGLVAYSVSLLIRKLRSSKESP